MKTRQSLKISTRAGYLAITLVVAGISPSASAAEQTWDGAASGIWDTSALNWAGAAFTSSNDALFTGTPTNNVTSATGLTIGAITLHSSFTGSVSMTGNNTVTGATTINGGTLAVLHTGTAINTVIATDLGTSAVTVNSGGTFSVDDTGNGTTGNERILAIGNNISGAGVINAKASALMTNGWSSINFTGDLSGFTGTLNIVTPSTANRAKVKFTTASQSTLLSSSATVNVQNGAQLYLTEARNYGFALKLNGGTGGEGFGSLRLENATLNVTGPITLQATSAITTSANATISGAIGESGGSFGFTKQGANTLVLSGNSSYSGGTTIAAANATTSTLSVGHNNALGTGTVTFSPTGSGVAVLANTTNVTLPNNLSTTSGVANLNASGGTMILNGNITGANGASLTPTNKITLAGTNSFATSAAFGNLNVNAGAGGVDITGSTSVGSGNSANSGGYLNTAGTNTITVQSGGSLSILGTTNVSTPGSIVGQNAAGTSTLAVNGGSLTIGGNTGIAFGNNVGTAIGVLTVSSGTATIAAGSATLQNSLNFVALGRDAATGIINLNGGTLATGRQFVRDGSSGGTAGTGTATFNFNGGTLQAQANQTSGNGWFETATTGNFQVVTTTVKAGGAKIDTSTFTTNINTVLAHDSTLGVTPDGGLIKNGSGTLSLGGVNTYTGATQIKEGMLALGLNGTICNTLVLGNASPATTGSLDVTAKTAFSEANVSGNGTINIGAGKTVTVTGSLAPGFSPGTLNVTGELALAASTSTTLELAGNGGIVGTDSDYVNVTGTLTLDGLLSITSYGGYDVTQTATYNLFDAASFTGDFDGVSVGGNTLSFATDVWSGTFSGTTYSFSETSGVLTVVPEPAAAMLGGLALLTLLRRRRQ